MDKSQAAENVNSADNPDTVFDVKNASRSARPMLKNFD